MRIVAPRSLALLLLAHIFIAYSCGHDEDEVVFVKDVSVDITGTAGVDFDAFFEDDKDAQRVSGSVPFSAEFEHQFQFFHASVEKRSGGDERICVAVVTGHESKASCTAEPFGRVSVTVSF